MRRRDKAYRIEDSVTSGECGRFQMERHVFYPRKAGLEFWRVVGEREG